MTRRSLMSRAKRIEKHVEKAWEIMNEIRNSDHPQAFEIHEMLREELGITSTCVVSCMERFLGDAK